MFMLIKGSEDGTSISMLNGIEVRELLADPRGNYGIRRFLPQPPDSGWDTNYWPEGDAILLRVNGIIEPVAVTTAYELPREK